jgi:hypothetical protein
MNLELRLGPAYAGESGTTTVLVKGDEVIAHVHQHFYAAMFCRAAAMRDLLVAVSRKSCDVNAQGTHAIDCDKCAARALLLQIDLDEVRLMNESGASSATATISQTGRE